MHSSGLWHPSNVVKCLYSCTNDSCGLNRLHLHTGQTPSSLTACHLCWRCKWRNLYQDGLHRNACSLYSQACPWLSILTEVSRTFQELVQCRGLYLQLVKHVIVLKQFPVLFAWRCFFRACFICFVLAGLISSTPVNGEAPSTTREGTGIQVNWSCIILLGLSWRWCCVCLSFILPSPRDCTSLTSAAHNKQMLL